MEHREPSSAWPVPTGELTRPAPSELRVLAAFGGLLALLAVAVLAAVFVITELRNDTTRLTDREVAYVQAVHRAALHAKGIANDERGYLLTGRPVFLKEVAFRTKQADAQFAAAARAATGDGQRLAIEEARIGYVRWLKRLRADIAAFRRGDEQRAIDSSLGPTRELRKDYERVLQLAHVLGVAAIETGSSSVSDSSSRSVTFLLVYLALALLVGGAIAVWIVRRILHPARATEP